jgi:hypothetical protein
MSRAPFAFGLKSGVSSPPSYHLLARAAKVDRGGYPHGLSGEKIPLAARAMCVVDSYDANRVVSFSPTEPALA